MKFQKLTIHNIASIEDAVIDFEAQPLADCEVFLITGKTGAGKSTILDAICLALYADTPRMDGTNMQGTTMDFDKEIQIDDPRQLMRRNTGEAFVKLVFTGSNDVHYESTWSVARARKNRTGALQYKKWELKNLDTAETLDKDNDIKDEIKAAVGLDFKQFCRTTMLAQGEFTRFLNSKDDEKAEILEHITGMDIYAKIGAKVFELTSLRKREWEDARRIVEGTRTLTEDERAEKQEEWNALDARHKEISGGGEKNVAKRDWLTKDNELKRRKSEADDALRSANEAAESDSFKKREQTMKDWSTSIDARMWLTEMQKAESAQKAQKELLEELAATYTRLLGGQKYDENAIRKTEEELKEIESAVSAEADKVCVYENAQTVVAHLTTIDEGNRAIENCQKTVESENRKQTDELSPALVKAQDDAGKARAALDKEEAEIKAKDEAIAKLNLPELREKRDAAKGLLGKIATAKERFDTLAAAVSQREETQKGLAERKDALEKKKAKTAEMETPVQEAKNAMEKCKADLDKQKDTVDKFAAGLRTRLQVGDTCPVCQQKIMSALPREEELTVLVGGYEKAYKDAEKKYNNLIEAKVELDAEIKTESKAYERDSKAFEEDRSVANAEQKVRDACAACGIEKQDDATLSTLSALENSQTLTHDELDAKIKEGEKQETAVKNLRLTLETKRKAVEALTTKVSEAEKALNECKGRITTAETLVRSKDEEVDNAVQKAAGLIVGKWETDWKKSPKEFATALTSSAREYNNRVQRKLTLTGKLETSKNNVANVREVLTAIVAGMPAWKELGTGNAEKVDNLLSKANELNASVHAALTRLNTAEENQKDYATKLRDFLEVHPKLNIESLVALNAYTSDDIARESDALKKAHEDVVAKNTLAIEAEKLIAEHLAKKPEFGEGDTLDALNERIEDTKRQLSEIDEKKGAINQELLTDKENRERLGTLNKEAEEKHALYQKWSRLNQMIGSSKGDNFRKIAQSYVLTSLIHSANSYMKTLTDRYKLKVKPGTFVILLEDAYQSAARRAASTISGGESFLVALSLALALSDIGQKWQVDTLFIDEGFGTLSGEPLQNAINTLRSLHSKAGRHVGIISHVEELQERIPVQIQVNQEGNNSSAKVKIIPEPHVI